MVVSLWDIASAVAGTLVLAAQSAVSPIPQGFDYSAVASYQIYNGHFSTGSLGQPRVAAIAAAAPQLEAFIINNSPCGNIGTPLSYRLLIRNIGGGAATEITVQNQYPDRTNLLSVSRSPDAIDPATRLLTWREGGLTAGNFLQYTLTVSGRPGTLTDILTVDYFDDNPVPSARQHFRTQTSHTIDDKDCEGGLAPTTPLPAGKSPAIICDPAEINCQPSLPNLGIRFKNAKGVVENPILGQRFQEAIADILPGECSVVADDIISTPDYQDALNRQGSPAAAYMQPLYQSGQDFKQLVLEDMILGWKQLIAVRAKLLELHGEKWQEHNDIVAKVVKGDISGKAARGQIQQLLTPWQRQLIPIQQEASRQYVQMQDERAKKFDPVAKQAVANARDSIQRACGTDSDGGLEQALPPVKQAYELTLNGRTTAYAATQQRFSGLTLVSIFWQEKLYPALDEFDRGNKKPLQDYQGSTSGIGRDSTFNGLFESYYTHLSDDEKSFNRVRLDNFEVALDKPKEEATVCEKKKVFGPPVEVSWCESVRYPEFIIRGAPEPVRRVFPPDTSSLDPTQSRIDLKQVRGQVCGGKPGDPWWSRGCECQCNEAVATGAVDANGNPLLFVCQGVFPIVLHDINVTSREECLSQVGHHGAGQELAPF